MCAACLRQVQQALWCEPCSRRVETGPPSKLARAALMTVRVGFALLMASWIGTYLVTPELIIGVCVSIPVGVAGFGLALVELAGQANGTSPRSGKPLMDSALLGAAFLIFGGAMVSYFTAFQ